MVHITTKKTNRHEPPPTNFWFGFALGATAGISALVLFGTEDGREKLKKLVEMSGNLEEHVGEVMKELKDKGEDIEEKVVEEVQQLGKKAEGNDNIQNVIDKIKNFSKLKESPKKFYVKD